MSFDLVYSQGQQVYVEEDISVALRAFICHFLWCELTCELSEPLCNILVITYLLLSLSFPVISSCMHRNTGVLIQLY